MRKNFVLMPLFFFLLSCSSEEANFQEAHVTAFEMQGVGIFALDKVITFAAHSDSTYYLRLLTEPATTPVYVLINQQRVPKRAVGWLKVDASVSSIKVLSKEGTKEVVFGWGMKDLLLSTALYPNPVKDSVTFRFSADTKGMVHTQIFNMQGMEVHSMYSLKKTDEHFQKQSLKELAPGLYIMKVRHGDSSEVMKIVKQ